MAGASSDKASAGGSNEQPAAGSPCVEGGLVAPLAPPPAAPRSLQQQDSKHLRFPRLLTTRWLLPLLFAMLVSGPPVTAVAQPGLVPNGEITGYQPEVIGTDQTVEATITVRNRSLKTNFWIAVTQSPPGWQVASMTPGEYLIDNDRTRDFRLQINPGGSPGNYNITVQLWARDVFGDPKLILTEAIAFDVVPPPSDFRIMVPQHDQEVSGVFQVSWTRSNHADNYNMRIRRLQGGSPTGAPVFQVLGTQERDFQLIAEDLFEPGTYYNIEVEANNRAFSGVAAENSPRRIRAQDPPPLGPFELTAPASPGDTLSTRPEFRWSASENADTYSLAVFPLQDGEMSPVPIAVVQGIEGTSHRWEEPVLSGGTEYYVSVSAQGLGGSRIVEGGPRRFRATALGTFDLISPNNNQPNQTLRPRFRWEPAAGADRYEIVIFEVLDDGTDRIIIHHDVPLQSGLVQYDVPQNRRLKPNTEYLWAVVAYSHNESQLNEGGVRRFTTIPMGGFHLLSPAPFETGVEQVPTFEWEPTAGVYAYMVEVARPGPNLKPDPDTIRRSPLVFGEETVLESPFDPLTIGETYLWRVGATDGDVTVWNSPNWQPFTVGAVGEFNLVAPADGAEGISVQPQFQWTTAENATGYRVRLWIDGTHELPPVEVEGQVTGVDLMEKGIFLNGQRDYTWTVEAVGLGTSRTAGSERTFNTTFREQFQSCDLVEHLLGMQKFSILDQQVSGVPRPFDISAYLRLAGEPGWDYCEPETTD